MVDPVPPPEERDAAMKDEPAYRVSVSPTPSGSEPDVRRRRRRARSASPILQRHGWAMPPPISELRSQAPVPGDVRDITDIEDVMAASAARAAETARVRQAYQDAKEVEWRQVQADRQRARKEAARKGKGKGRGGPSGAAAAPPTTRGVGSGYPRATAAEIAARTDPVARERRLREAFAGPSAAAAAAEPGLS